MRVGKDGLGDIGDLERQSLEFAGAVVHLVRQLKGDVPPALADRIVAVGTGIGADVADAGTSTSRRTQLSRLEEARRASRQMAYWLRLLVEGDLVEEQSIRPYLEDGHALHVALADMCIKARELSDS